MKTQGFYGFCERTGLENCLRCLNLHLCSERVQTLDIRSSQDKVPLDVRIVPLNQSTPEISTKVHVLRGLSLKVVTLEFILQYMHMHTTYCLNELHTRHSHTQFLLCFCKVVTPSSTAPSFPQGARERPPVSVLAESSGRLSLHQAAPAVHPPQEDEVQGPVHPTLGAAASELQCSGAGLLVLSGRR